MRRVTEACFARGIKGHGMALFFVRLVGDRFIPSNVKTIGFVGTGLALLLGGSDSKWCLQSG